MRGLVFAVAAVAVPLACSSGGPGITDNGDLGQPCHRSEDCANGYCVPRVGETITDTVAGVCTHPCARSDDCLRGWFCVANASAVDLCACGSPLCQRA